MSAYLSRRGLLQLEGRLSDRDLAVIRSVDEHRFLTARHIEALHFADHASELAGARVCRRVLARLSRDRVLTRLQRRVGGVRAGSASFVYALGPIGARLRNDGSRRRFTEPSALFLHHALAVADAHVALVNGERAGRFELVRLEVEPRCWRRFLGAGGAREAIKPDLSVITASGAFEHLWYLEIDRATQGAGAIARKCRSYEVYWRTGFEQERTGTFPRVVWVAPDTTRARRIEQVVARLRGVKRDLFRFTTEGQLIELLAGGAA
jgi:Replication-relaxation